MSVVLFCYFIYIFFNGCYVMMLCVKKKKNVDNKKIKSISNLPDPKNKSTTTKIQVQGEYG